MSGVESWVQLGFVITEDGSVTEVEVLESGGTTRHHRDMERAAAKVLKRWRFQPAMVDGVPVRRSATQTIDFWLKRPAPLVTSAFREQAEEAAKAMEQGDLERAEAALDALDELTQRTRSERMFRSFLRGLYYEAMGDQARALQEAESALSMFRDGTRMPAYDQLLKMTFRLNALESNYLTALSRYEELAQADGVLSDDDPIHAQAQKIRDRLNDDDAIVVAGVTETCSNCESETHYFKRKLNRQRFYVDAEPDVIERIRIDCGPAHVNLEWRNDLIWKLDHEPGDCDVLVYGEPNRQITLVELNDAS